MLELNKLLDNVEAMSQEMARRQRVYTDRATRAKEALLRFDLVTDDMLDKIDRAISEDPSWRGAMPVGDVGSRLSQRHRPTGALTPASLIGVDGSQIYPDRHGFTLYYLVNTGSIILRQGSGQAPITITQPTLFFREEDLYNEDKELVDNTVVNAAREMAEIREMARLAVWEREQSGGDLDQLIVALTDGPLLIWLGEKSAESRREVRERIAAYLAELQAMQAVGTVPVGYVDRPRSANVLRMLHIAEIDLPKLSKETIRDTKYRGLTDRLLFEDLLPNERTTLFTSTAEVNRQDFRNAGQEAHFFYLNVARDTAPDAARIVRVDVPAWVSAQPDLLDRVHLAIYHDCADTEYPYVLARAHELALVTHRERGDFEHMLGISMLRMGLIPASSQKAFLKQLL